MEAQQLKEMKVSLAEVVDECLVLEAERDEMRRKYLAALDTSRTLAETVQSVKTYTEIMEAAVISCMPKLTLPGVAKGTGIDGLLQTGGLTSQESVLFVAEVAAHMQRVEQDVNDIIASVCAAKRQLSCSPGLRQEDREPLLPAPEEGRRISLLDETVELRREARLRAAEMTVTALNSEVASWQSRYKELQERTTREQDASKQQTLRETQALRAQIDESDAVLGRLSHELEVLIDENARLKQQLRCSGVAPSC